MTWQPAPEGPPPARNARTNSLLNWVREHPGEWAVIKGGSNGIAAPWRRRGCEVTTRMIPTPNGGKPRFDIYIRLPINQISDTDNDTMGR